MVYWSSFRAVLMCGMPHLINPQHKNIWHHWIYSDSYPYSQDKFRVLSSSTNQAILSYPSNTVPSLSFGDDIQNEVKTPQQFSTASLLHHYCTRSHRDNNQSTLTSDYINILVNSTINSCCTPPCNIQWWYQTLNQFRGCKYQTNHQLQNSHFHLSSNQFHLHIDKHHKTAIKY